MCRSGWGPELVPDMHHLCKDGYEAQVLMHNAKDFPQRLEPMSEKVQKCYKSKRSARFCFRVKKKEKRLKEKWARFLAAKEKKQLERQ